MDQAQALKDILETVQFLREHAASKEDLSDFATKGDLRKAKDEIMTHVDGFIVLHQKVVAELAAAQSNNDRLAKRIDQLARHLHFTFSDA